MAILPPRRNFRAVSPNLWPRRQLLQAPLGLDTANILGQVGIGALAIAKNVNLDKRGAIQVRRHGVTAYGATVGDTTKGEYELVRNDGTKYLLRVRGDNGKLYASSDDAATWTQLPIRLYRPYPAVADNTTVGENLNGSPLNPAENTGTAAGANIAAATSYDYAVLAVYGGGKTTLSDVATIVSANPAEQIKINFHGVYKAQTYEVWRRTTTGPGTWGRLATGVTHTTTGGKTLIQWTDDGNTAPDTTVTPPASNTTEHTLPTTKWVDWETDIWSSDKAAFFVAGDGICVTDGSTAQIVQPTDPGDYLESAAGVNALGDVTNAIHKAEGLTRNHAYLFYAGSVDAPERVFWGRADDAFHVPALGRIDVPRAGGGRTLDMGVKDKQLVILMTTGVWALQGTKFDPLAPDLTQIYFKQLSSYGSESGRTLAKAPNGWLVYKSNEPAIRAVVTAEGTDGVLHVIELAPNVRPTLEDMTDHTNAWAIFAERQYILGFPSDADFVRIYLFEATEADRLGMRSDQVVRWVPVQDTERPYRGGLVRQDGTVLFSHDTDGQYRKGFDGWADSGDDITGTFEFPPLDLGDPRLVKHVSNVYVILEQPNADSSLTLTLLSDKMSASISETLTGLGEGYDLSTYDTDVYDPFTARSQQVEVNNEGRWWVLGGSDTGSTEPITIYGFQFKAVYVEEDD